MKKAISVALFTVLFIAVCAGALFGYFKYNQTDFSFADGTKSGTLEISRYNGDAVNIEIPSSYHGKKVAYISKDAIELLLNEVHSNSNVEIVVGNTYSEPHDDYYELTPNNFPYRINNNNLQIRKVFFCNQSVILSQ